MSDFIPIARPYIGEEEAAAVRRPLESGWVTQGPEVHAFEQEFAAYVGSTHACAVSNCTAALHLALKAVGVVPGSEVITVSHSFIATANSIRYCGAIPVFVDIDPETYNIDPASVEVAISDRTRAILCVHQIGMPCDLQAILPVARRHNIPVVEDAACATGSEIRWHGEWQRIGRPHGDVACFSFHPRKVITTGDGGMLTTRDGRYDEQFRLWRQHSMSVRDTVRHQSDTVIFEDYGELGYNYRMTDIQAAIGRVQLQRLPEIVSRRRALAAWYTDLLKDIPGVMLPSEPGWARSNWQSFAVRLPDGVDQLQTMQFLLRAGIASRRGIMCAHREQAYAETSWLCGTCNETCTAPHRECSGLSRSERAQDQSILLPLYHDMTQKDLIYVVEVLGQAIASQVESTAAEQLS